MVAVEETAVFIYFFVVFISIPTCTVFFTI